MLHEKIRAKAKNGKVKLSELKPNSREVAQRMIAEGKLIKSGDGFVWFEVAR